MIQGFPPFKVKHRYRSTRKAIYLCARRREYCHILMKPTRAGYVAYGVQFKLGAS